MAKQPDEVALIELAYMASFVALADKSGRPWDQPIGEILPSEMERDCYRLSTQLGLTPPFDFETIGGFNETWRRQLKDQRKREIFDIGCLLVRQHASVTFLQCHPDSPARPEICYQLNEIRRILTRLFMTYNLDDSIDKLPALPLIGAPDTWTTWSGDALRDSVVKGLGGSTE